MIASFLFVQALALAVGGQFVAQKISVVENPADVSNAGFFFAYVLGTAVILLLILKFYRGILLFQAIEFILLFVSLQVLLSLVLPSDFAATGIALALAVGRFFFPAARAPLLLVASAVVGALLGASLDILPAVVFSALLAGYDVVAVFYTKHMVALAQGLSDRGAAFSIRFTSEKAGKEKQVKLHAKERLPAAGKPLGQNEVESIELGTGDLVIPAMLHVSALKLSLVHAIASFAGGALGLAFLFYVLEKQRGYWPALPPIVFGALAAAGAAQLLIVYKVI